MQNTDSNFCLTDDGKDADSLLDDTVANSNQNNSNCSSPSRMSDSVSLTTDSSQDNSLCTPEREAKMPFLPKSRLVLFRMVIYTKEGSAPPALILLFQYLSSF